MLERGIVKSLLDIHPEIDKCVRDLAYYGLLYKEFHPAAAGDVSQVFSPCCGEELLKIFSPNASIWIPIKKLEEMARLRHDGRTDYRSEGINDPAYYKAISSMAGRLMLITSTGSQIPAISQSLTRGEDGRLLVIIEVDKNATSIRIIYGNKEFGTIPSIETHIHLVSNAISISQGISSPATVHAHPFSLIKLGMDRRVAGDFHSLNALLYSQAEGINRIDPGFVAIIPYAPSGSAELVNKSFNAITVHRLILWMNHGFTVRSHNIERGYALMAYAEQSAKIAIEAIEGKLLGLPLKYIPGIVNNPKFYEAYKKLKLKPHK